MGRGNYQAGQVLSGRIVQISDSGVTVVLENGDTITAPRSSLPPESMALGRVLRFAVQMIDGNGRAHLAICRETPKEPEPPRQEATPLEEGSWNGWSDMLLGHGRAVAALTGLRDFSRDFLRELTEARRVMEEEKRQSARRCAAVSDEAQARYERETQKHTSACAQSVSTLQIREGKAFAVLQSCEAFQRALPKSWRGREAAETAGRRMDALREAQQQVTQAVQVEVAAWETLRDSRITEARSLCAATKDTARREQIDRDAQIERRYHAAAEAICRRRRRGIQAGFSQEMVHACRQEARGLCFSAEHYRCPDALPECVLLGTLGIRIPDGGQDELSVVQAVESQTAGAGERRPGEYVVRLPYGQRLEDGISLLIRYAPEAREQIQGNFQNLLLKLFMAFPAGRLEATMIDPMELGRNFPDIPKLVDSPNDARIIDTKIWSSEQDIQRALTTLRIRMEEMTQSYGEDWQSRLRKECLRVLAVTDFPAGFSETALKELGAIVRNSASLGVFVLICANDAELEKLRQKNGALLREIEQSMVNTRLSGDRLLLSAPGCEGLFLELDDMRDALAHKEEILTRIRMDIARNPAGIEPFAGMFKGDIYDSNSWFRGDEGETAIPIGIRGASHIVKMVLGRGGGSTEHHALIAGQTGAGKSTLLHTLIMSALISYSPEDVQMYLLDFKEGVEFNIYTRYRLPSLRAVAINSEREFGLSILRELCTELETRTKLFSRYNTTDYLGYRSLPDAPKIPRLLLLFDELQELFPSRGDAISGECLDCLKRLVNQGRAVGIHVILACQNFAGCGGVKELFTSMAIRIAVKGSEEGAASILDAGNTKMQALRNQRAGAAIYSRDGLDATSSIFQISMIREEERMKLLSCLDRYYTDPVVEGLYAEDRTRILLNNAEDDIRNCFNQLIAGRMPGPIAVDRQAVGLLLGLGFGRRDRFTLELSAARRNNLLIVSKDETMALGLFEMALMSIFYEGLQRNWDWSRRTVYVLDLFAGELKDGECGFGDIRDLLPRQMEVTRLPEAEGLIESLYQMLLRRKEAGTPPSQPTFLLFFGIDRARRLCSGGIYGDSTESGLGYLEMLEQVLDEGPQWGLNAIVWSESVHGLERLLGDRCQRLFDKRIAYRLDEASMDQLVMEEDEAEGKTAVYMDIRQDVRNTHFRPYDLPARVWMEDYAGAVQARIAERGGQ